MADKDILATARDRYKRAIEAEDDNRKHAKEVLDFRNGEHWDQKIKSERLNDPEGSRPCEVADKTEQHMNQVVNQQRQNRPSIKVRPVDDKSDPEVADVFQGLVRHIEDRSSADIAYDTGYEHSADAGFGYWRVLTEYADPMSFEQDIVIKRIRNRFQVVLDPDRQEPDGSDAKYGFIVEKMKKEEYEAQYGKDHAIDFDQESAVYKDWIEKEHVLVAEYFRIEYEKKSLCLWASGYVSIKEEGKKPEAQPGDKIVKERVSRVPVVKWSKINGKEEIESRDWLGKYIPIVECVGHELDIEGKVHRSGLLKRAMGPQRMHDYAVSAFIENVALAPRAPWVAAEGQLEGHENDWRTANKRSFSVLQYKPVLLEGNVQVPPPQRNPPPGIPAGWQQVLMNSEHDIQSAMGRYDASLGADSNEKSGVALQKKQNESDTATFHFQDNLARSIRHTGRILLDLIPKIYDTKRVARILGEDGSTDQVMLDPNQESAVMDNPEQDSKIKKIYNLNVGVYDVTVSTGPSYTTRRQEAADQMVQVLTAKPELLTIIGDLAFRSMDWPGADAIADRLKKMLPPNLQEAEDGEEVPMVMTPQGPMPAPQASEMMQGMQMELEQAQEMLKKAGDLQEIEGQVKNEAVKLDSKQKGLQYEVEIFDLKKQIAHQEFEAQAANQQRLQEDVNRQAEEAGKMRDEANATQEGAKAEQASNTEVLQAVAGGLSEIGQGMQQQAQAIGAQAQAIAGLAQAVQAPRKRTPVRGPDGEIAEVRDEVVS